MKCYLLKRQGRCDAIKCRHAATDRRAARAVRLMLIRASRFTIKGSMNLMPTMAFSEFRLSGFASASKRRAPTKPSDPGFVQWSGVFQTPWACHGSHLRPQPREGPWGARGLVAELTQRAVRDPLIVFSTSLGYKGCPAAD
jgi:hypothetical protein